MLVLTEFSYFIRYCFVVIDVHLLCSTYPLAENSKYIISQSKIEYTTVTGQIIIETELYASIIKMICINH